ncbi:hypothetical protein L2E82_12117 [Cichorium intybus]|uniref:Uncharacterized protein n=1 Tax=Cichorium intybus TaxID=13427 RepID=A0ACB9GF70_CICIN|nr:hypothetical protein L2E82_12117 [Cichorium intybus]
MTNLEHVFVVAERESSAYVVAKANSSASVVAEAESPEMDDYGWNRRRRCEGLSICYGGVGVSGGCCGESRLDGVGCNRGGLAGVVVAGIEEDDMKC